MKLPRSNDRRVLRTRAMLRDALIALMAERGWDAIGIRDICARAGVGRSTFYTHFADKEELLLDGYESLRRLLRESRPSAARGTSASVLSFSRGLLEHAHENRRLFRALVGKRSSQVVVRRFLALVIELTTEELAPLFGKRAGLEATVQYIAGAFLQLVAWSLEARKPVAPTELDEAIQRLTRAVLKAATGGLRRGADE